MPRVRQLEQGICLQIIRNLSACWYHDVPDVQIHGRLPPISIKLSQPDLKSIMSVLDENLKEGQTEVSGKEIEKGKKMCVFSTHWHKQVENALENHREWPMH